MTKRSTSAPALAVASILVFAACGSADDGSEGGSADTPSTTVADDQLRAPTPIEIVSGGSAGAATGSAIESAPAAGGGEIATSDMMIAPWNVEYEVGNSLPDLPTDDTGYVFAGAATGSPVTADQVARLAEVFGVDGEPVSFDDGFGVNWRVGPEDGSGASIWVVGDGPQSWNYNAPWGEAFESCAVSVDADGNESSDCPEPEAPSGVPSADEAEQRARELLSALGVDVSSLTFESFGDRWFTSVQVSDDTDSRAAVRSWSFGFGGDALLQYAGGSLATPEPVGPYPLVDLDTAVARLSDFFFGGLPVGGGIAIAEPALPTVGATEEVTIESEAVTGGPAEPPTVEDETASVEPGEPVDPMPVEPVPEGDPAIITLVDVQADLWWAWDVDGAAWLLPAYRFIDTDGGWHVVPAVTDEFLIQADPPVFDTPLPAPEPLPAPAPDVIEPDLDPESAAALLEELVGLSIEEFTAEAQARGYSTRIVMQDGEPLEVTADYSETRVNVAVDGPRVVAIDGIG